MCIIGSRNVFAPLRPHAITWNNDDSVYDAYMCHRPQRLEHQQLIYCYSWFRFILLICRSNFVYQLSAPNELVHRDVFI